jgi:hypothetical protein
VNDLMEDGRPFVVSAEFTSFMSEKANLRKFLEAWRGKPFTEEERAGFDVKRLLGVPAFVNVVHGKSKKGRTYAELVSASPLPRGMPRPDSINPPVSYEVEDGYPPESIPDWIRKKILDSDEFKGAANPPASTGHDVNPEDPDCPF